jgi:hypothetical protein
MLILRALQTSWVQRIGHIRRTGGESPEVPKLIWAVDLRIPGSYPDRRIYDVVNLVLTASGGQEYCNHQNPLLEGLRGRSPPESSISEDRCQKI